MRWLPSFLHRSRITRISACAVGSEFSIVEFPARATISPLCVFTRIAPIGTSSRIDARFASSSAHFIAVVSFSMSEEDHKEERIAKRMARGGLCSRRDAERWIADGRVSVNGKKLDTPAFKVGANDKIVVDGKVLGEAATTRLFLYHKPKGLVTTHKDEQGRSTVFSQLPERLPRVVSVGRLDLNTEGLLLLTNDGGLSRYLELPATGWKRRYRVRVHGYVDQKKIDALRGGMKVDGVQYKSIEAKIDKDTSGGANTWMSVILKEGKNREIRRVMEALDLKVNRLIREAYGPFELGNLTTGSVTEVRNKIMKDQVSGYFGAKK